LNGRKLKKDLGLKKASKRYHNKHVKGSGNFGFTLRTEDGGFFDLSGDYKHDGRIYHLDLAYKWRNFQSVPMNEIKSYEKLVEYLKPLIVVPVE
jgi:hypothetical protein